MGSSLLPIQLPCHELVLSYLAFDSRYSRARTISSTGRRGRANSLVPAVRNPPGPLLPPPDSLRETRTCHVDGCLEGARDKGVRHGRTEHESVRLQPGHLPEQPPPPNPPNPRMPTTS